MAILQAQAENSSGFEIDGLPPSGNYVATCLEIADEFGVTRRKFQSEETEEIDVTRFLFGFKGKDGNLHKVQTWEMKISGSPKSKLYKFLSDWLGKAPTMGWDYCELKEKGAVIKVEHKTSQMGKTYAYIENIAPVKTDLNDYSDRVVPASQFGSQSVPAEVTNDDPNCPF